MSLQAPQRPQAPGIPEKTVANFHRLHSFQDRFDNRRGKVLQIKQHRPEFRVCSLYDGMDYCLPGDGRSCKPCCPEEASSFLLA